MLAVLKSQDLVPAKLSSRPFLQNQCAIVDMIFENSNGLII
jgi:hypothetical protein